MPILTAVDLLNEGVDVPDVNILCFARVTHSRRIFVQQLGRGLRLREGKSHVLVLDFVSTSAASLPPCGSSGRWRMTLRN